jgi:hypothetical protein
MISEYWIEKNIEGIGRGLLWGISQKFALKTEKPGRVATPWAEIWTQDIPNTKYDRYNLNCNVDLNLRLDIRTLHSYKLLPVQGKCLHVLSLI